MNLLAALAVAASVQAVDNPATWTPAQTSIHVGDTVTWTFDGTNDLHNVKATSANWSFETAFDRTPKTYTFTAAGTYTFQCQAHPSTMTGTITVGDAPPPPPPAPSEQPFPNDAPAPTVFEVTDERRPRLSRVRVAGHLHGVLVRFRVSEPARVTVRVKRGRRAVARRTGRGRRGAIYVGDLPAGRYRVEVFARDLAGNRSQIDRTPVRVR